MTSYFPDCFVFSLGFFCKGVKTEEKKEAKLKLQAAIRPSPPLVTAGGTFPRKTAGHALQLKLHGNVKGVSKAGYHIVTTNGGHVITTPEN